MRMPRRPTSARLRAGAHVVQHSSITPLGVGGGEAQLRHWDAQRISGEDDAPQIAEAQKLVLEWKPTTN